MFKNLSIAGRLGIGFGLTVLILMAAMLFALMRMGQVNGLLANVVQNDWQKVRLVSESAEMMNGIARQSYAFLLFGDREAVEQVFEYREKITRNLEQIKPLIHLAEGQEFLRKVVQQRALFVNSYQQVLETYEHGYEAEAYEQMENETMPALNLLLELMNNWVHFQGEVLQRSGDQAEEFYTQTRISMWAIIALAWLLSTLLAWWIIRSVTRPLGGEPLQVKEVAERISEGDLTQHIELKQQNADSLMNAMVQMQRNLKEIISDLSSNADGVASSALQLAQASRQINQGSASQTQASVGMAAAVEQMTASIRQVSDNAANALTTTTETQQLASEGERSFHQTIDGMQRIVQSVEHAQSSLLEMNQNTHNITGILQMISEVAERTNLLALNAAIEAARAGEHGRGFAVVADEVRQLADQTTVATGEITQMIDLVQGSATSVEGTMQHVVEQVHSGMSLAQAAGAAMQNIGLGANQVVAAVEQITRTLQEQNSVSHDISGQIEQIAQMSEENHQAINEVMLTAEALETLANSALVTVQRFRI